MSNQDSTPDYDNFLDDLQWLCDQYGIYIEGCGCCDSPWLTCKDKAHYKVTDTSRSMALTLEYKDEDR